MNITSDLPLSSEYPTWRVISGGVVHGLPQSAIVDNYYTTDGVLHSRVLLHNLSFTDDTGNYTNIANNECGDSLAFVYINVRKGMLLLCVSSTCHQLLLFVSLAVVNCNDSVKIIGSSQNVTTVLGERVQFRCLVQGNLPSLDLSLTSIWKVDPPAPQDHGSIIIYDNSTSPYSIAVYPTCKSCCNFTSQLTITSVPPELNGAAKLTCVESLEIAGKDPLIQQSTSMLSK